MSELLVLQLSQAFLQGLDVRLPLFTLATAGAALQELHLHGQLAELKVLALLSQIHAATTNGAILRAEDCRASHPQGVPVGRGDSDERLAGLEIYKVTGNYGI